MLSYSHKIVESAPNVFNTKRFLVQFFVVVTLGELKNEKNTLHVDTLVGALCCSMTMFTNNQIAEISLSTSH